MERPETPFGGQDSAGQRGLYLAMELSHRQWQLGVTDRRHKMRRVTVEARNLVALQEQIRLAKTHFRLPAEAPVFSCYEAGRDGFWLHRYLASCGIDNQVLEPLLDQGRPAPTPSQDRSMPARVKQRCSPRGHSRAPPRKSPRTSRTPPKA